VAGGFLMRDIYQNVTNEILAELRAGARPWMRPWSRTPGLNTQQIVGAQLLKRAVS
jgi:antirestriction protein ArdC